MFVYLAEFKAKYTQQNQLGKGGCGCVFAGYRNADNLPVRVTHVFKHKHIHRQSDLKTLTKVLFVCYR